MAEILGLGTVILLDWGKSGMKLFGVGSAGLDGDGNRMEVGARGIEVMGSVCQVIGVGGGGSNAVNRMMQGDVQGVEFYVVNTDSQVSAATGNL